MPTQHPFYFLSNAFAYPEKDNRRLMAEALASLASDLGMEKIEAATLGDIPFEELQAEYVRLFINAPGGVAAPPHASIYIGGSGLLMQQGHDQAMAFYSQAGLAPVGAREEADHLSRELAFVGHLLDSGDDQLLNEFLSKHLLRWYPDFLARLLAARPCPFYSVLGQVTHMSAKYYR